MKLNAQVRTRIESSVLCWLASVDASGWPSVSPKEIWAVQDDSTLVIADIASTNSVRNIRAHPSICLSFVDIFRQRGFKIQGHAEIVGSGSPDFGTLSPKLTELAGDSFEIRNIIRLDIKRIAPIVAPSYRVFADMDEQAMMAAAFKTYGVRPA
jgi:predicted pyridoxine 5'-phosphate oxidase superfamily flavin-nucleotide-binding protein